MQQKYSPGQGRKLNRRLAGGLRDLSRQADVELSIVLLAAIKTLLFRITGETDVKVGFPVCAQLLVLRTQLHGALTFGQALARTNETVMGIEADLSRHPLFQVVFHAVFNIEEGLDPLELSATQVSLTLGLSRLDDDIECLWRHNTDRFDASTIARLARHFEVLLQGLLADASTPLSDLPLLTAGERHEMAIEWNDTRLASQRDTCFHQLFEDWAERAPEKVALDFEDQAMSYRELDRSANRVAHGLIGLGLLREERVGLCLERGPALIIALLGVLKSGAAYMPLDPTYPEERLTFMLRDSRVEILLTRKHLLEARPERPVQGSWPAHGTLTRPSGLRCVPSRTPGRAFPAEPLGSWCENALSTRPESGVGLGNLAYMMYTSGSTGRPKGVLVSHRGLANVARVQQATFGVGPGDRVLQFAAFSYDASVWEFVMALASGATLQLAPSEDLYPGPGLHRLLRDRRVTSMTIAPTALAAMPHEPLPDLRTLIVAGEECPADVARRWSVGRSFFNAYGPTESTIWASVDVGAGRPAGKPLIGRAIANFEIYVVGPGLQIIALGLAGELLLGSDISLARGYFERPALTAEKFIPHAFTGGVSAGGPGARLYRTGDLARLLADGRIDFLGRRDAQVKIRGFRIELEEIEAVLKEQPNLVETVVLIRQDQPGHERLVAYVVLDGADATVELRRRLRARLPEFMVPTVFVSLDALPRMPNGKVDRRRLPPPSRRPDTGTDHVSPRTSAQQCLAQIWAEVLKVERVGLHDNYFDLGGDSILAMQVIARAREAGLRLTPKQLFRYPTVAEQTEVAAASAGRPAEPAEDPWTGELPLTPIEHWFFELALTNPNHWNQSVLLETPPGLQGKILRKAVDHLVRRHDALRLRFEKPDGNWHRRVVPPEEATSVTDPPVSEVDLSSLRGGWRRAMEAACGEAQGSLNLSAGPVVRVVLFRLERERPGRLLVVVHHLAVDGVSWRILLEDLRTGIQQLAGGGSVVLPGRTGSLKNWADRLVGLAASGELHAESWLENSAAVPLPRDDSGGPNIEASASTVAVSLTARETDRLLTADVRVHEVLLAAVVEALGSWTGSRRLVVDVEGHGREGLDEEDDFSRTVGWFTTLYPLVLERGAESPRQHWRAAAETGLDFGVLRYLQRTLPASRRPEVVFNYLGSVNALTEGDELRLAREPMGPWRDPRNPRTHVLEISVFVLGGRLRMLWTFSRNLHRRATFIRLARRFKADLKTALPASKAALPASDQNRAYPLSPLQEGMLYHSRLAPGSGIYIEQFRLSLEGGLDASLLRRAWRSLTASHAMLRTACRWAGEEQPSQRIFHHVESPWTELDWRGNSAWMLEEKLEVFLRQDRRRDFMLSEAPLFRLTLIRTSERSWEWIWTYHHLLLDGWSVGILLKDLLRRYDLLAAGREPESSFPGPPYRDYVAWLGRMDSEQQADYWRLTLGDFTAATPLAVECSSPRRGAEPGYGDRELSLRAAVTAALGNLARRHRCTSSILVQAAWALLLGRYSHHRDVVFGLTLATRPAELDQVESMVGLMINTLPTRVRLPEDVALGPWLQAIQENLLELLEQDATPLAHAQGWSGVARDQPLFESLLVYESYPLDRSFWRLFQGFRIRRLQGFGWTSYPLTLLVVPSSELVLRVKYDRRRFDDTTAGRLLRHFAALLESMTEGPGDPFLSDLSLLTPAEQHQLRVEWNDTDTDVPSGVCIHQLFEAQVQRTPESVALVAGDTRLSYCGLDHQTGQLAHSLRGQGVGPEVRVGLCCQRTAAQIVAVLAILKAGGAYLPLDPRHPKLHREKLLKQARARVLLDTSSIFRRGRPPCLPSARQNLESRAESLVTDRNLAYVLFTSGSTGRPKGVAVEHRQLVHYVVDVLDRLNLRGPGRFLMVQPLTVDSSVTMLYPPLITGGTLHLVSREQAIDPQALRGEFQRRPADHLKIAPSHLEALAALGGLGPYLPRRSLIVGGEASPWQRSLELASSVPGQLFSHYGPTETTVGVLACRVNPAAAERSVMTTPLGRPLANTAIHLLDRQLGRVALGAPGELCVSGALLARGYLDLPRQTAEVFIPDPFLGGWCEIPVQEPWPAHRTLARPSGLRCAPSRAPGRVFHTSLPGPGAQLYRTGDLARYLADGVVEFLGRRDHQVKVRGYRLDLGEIEVALAEHPEVRSCVVTLGKNRDLTAHVVGPPEGSNAALMDFLRRKLPDHMVPRALVLTAALPLTPHGKVDRRALARLDVASSEERPPRNGFTRVRNEPRTPVEELLAGIWSRVLEVDQIGATDNFFELGGHSLLATRVISRILDLWRVELPLRVLFEAPTVARLARRIEAAVQTGSVAQAPPLLPRKDPSANPPLSFAQQRLWFLDKIGAGSAYNMLEAVRWTGRLNPSALRRCLAEIVARHETLRTRFPSIGGEPRQHVATTLELSQPWVPLPWVDLSALPQARREKEARRRAAEEAHRPFDLASGPLIRCCLLRMGKTDLDETHVLLLTLHHIISDGWSMGLLRREIGVHYRRLVSGREPSLPDLPVQYADFTIWQRDWLSGEVLASQLAYWRRRLDGLTDLDLPTDRPRPPFRSYRGALLSLRIPERVNARLRRLGSDVGATLFMVQLAAFKALLHRHTGQRDFAVGSPIAGRNRSEVEGLIGFFVNTLVLRANLTDQFGFGEWLGQCRDAALDAYAHQDLPFEKLVRELQPERDLARSPLFQVMFVLQNAPSEAVEVPGLTLHPLPWDPETAIFDLALSIEELSIEEQPIEEQGAGLSTWWRYSTDLFDRSTILRLAQHYEVLLSAVVENPATRMAALSALTPAETHQLCREWNDTDITSRASAALPHTVVDMFDCRANAVSAATAVTFARPAAATLCLSYAGLDKRARGLARFLKQRGAGRGSRVGLCLPRSPDLLVGLLAILKAGAAYVPLDPALPDERLAHMISASGASILLTHRSHRQKLDLAVSDTICLDTTESAFDQRAGDDPIPLTPPDPLDLAYVIFTSGSTGRPKGVAMPHGPVANLIDWHLETLLTGARSLQRAPLSFDGSFHEIFATWCSGGNLELAAEDLHRDVPALLRLLISSNIEKAKLPAVALDHLVEAWRGQGCPPLALRELTVSGSALRMTPPIIDFFQHHPHLTLHNHYGPSETHMVIAHPMASEPSRWPVRPSIGRPISATRAHVLDQQGQPVAIGVSGEINISGICSARGYVGAPAQTATSFPPDPFGRAGNRLYRTGDLACFRADGRLDFLGRRDHQVKIRGFRVELGEIETVAMEHPGVRQVVVSADDQHDLVLYIVPEEANLDWGQLRAHLRRRLPEYMVPQKRLIVESLPLTTSGKIHRQALTELEEEDDESDVYVTPEGPMQEKIAALWREILGVNRVGAEDNFFTLGGHSLRATRLVARLRRSFGVEVPVRVVFEAPTVAEMELAIIRRLAQGENKSELGSMMEAIQGLSEDELRKLLIDEDME